MSAKKQELKNNIEELEAALSDLKKSLHAVESNEQHEAIDHLEEHLEAVNHKWENVRSFWPLVLIELRELFDRKAN